MSLENWNRLLHEAEKIREQKRREKQGTTGRKVGSRIQNGQHCTAARSRRQQDPETPSGQSQMPLLPF